MGNRLTIYFTSDTHGYLYPTNFLDEKKHPMGLLGMRFKKDGNTLVIDGGDTLQGSPLTYYCRSVGDLSPVADALNAHGYDYVTIGNHDFNYGADLLASYLKQLNARCLCANVVDAKGRLPVLPACVHTLENGMRVGLVGIVTDWVKLWEKRENLEAIEISEPLEAARAAMQGMDADIWVGIYHGGVERDTNTGELLSETDENIACKLCEQLPLKLLLTGHQHIAMVEKTWKGVHIVQTPVNATAYVRVTMDDAGDFHSELCAVDETVCLTEQQQVLWEKLNAWLDRPIGQISCALRPGDKLDMAMNGSKIADFFNLVQLSSSGAELSCTSLGNEMRGFDTRVTVRDVVATYVYPNTLVVLRVTGAQLRQALEQCARYFDLRPDGSIGIAESFLKPKEAHYNYDFFSGLEYAFDLSKPAGNRVVLLSRKGRSIADEDSFTLCMNNYRATGAGDFDCYLGCPREKEIQTEISELILDYLSAHRYVEIVDAPCFHTLRP